LLGLAEVLELQPLVKMAGIVLLIAQLFQQKVALVPQQMVVQVAVRPHQVLVILNFLVELAAPGVEELLALAEVPLDIPQHLQRRVRPILILVQAGAALAYLAEQIHQLEVKLIISPGLRDLADKTVLRLHLLVLEERADFTVAAAVHPVVGILAEMVLAVAFVLFGLVMYEHFLLPMQGLNNGTLYSN
jgi:hypothetical protein